MPNPPKICLLPLTHLCNGEHLPPIRLNFSLGPHIQNGAPLCLGDYVCYSATNTDVESIGPGKPYPLFHYFTFDNLSTSHKSYALALFFQNRAQELSRGFSICRLAQSNGDGDLCFRAKMTWELVELPLGIIPTRCR